MQRRRFLALIGVACGSALAQAQKRARIGVLISGNPEPFFTAFKKALGAEGYQAGRNLDIEFRSVQDKNAALSDLAAELARSNVEVIVAYPDPAAEAAKRATTSIPIVFLAGDPLGAGLIASYARPGGNMTGISGEIAATAGKCVEILKEAMPSVKQVVVIANAANPSQQAYLQHVALAGLNAAVQIRTVMVKPAQIAEAFAQFKMARPDFLIVLPTLPRARIIEMALEQRLPTIGAGVAFAREGGLLSYAANLDEMYRSTAAYVAKILKGARPSELPVQMPTRYDLTVNLKTAKAIGFALPRALLLRAEVIQ